MSDKPPAAPDEPKRRSDARRSTRFPTRFPGELVANGQSTAIKVRDISREGLMIEGERLPGAGREVVVTAKQLDAEARVIWQRDALSGLEFSKPIDPLEIVRQNVPELARFRRQTKK